MRRLNDGTEHAPRALLVDLGSTASCCGARRVTDVVVYDCLSSDEEVAATAVGLARQAGTGCRATIHTIGRRGQLALKYWYDEVVWRHERRKKEDAGGCSGAHAPLYGTQP